MLSESGVSAAARLLLDIRQLPWMKRLAVDYAFDYSRLAPFYAGDPRTDSAWRDAITRTQRHDRPRAEVAGLLLAQQRRRGAHELALAATERLKSPGTVAIVTGQQAGLFGGPLFTLLKALTAIRMADQVSRSYGVSAVPVFWVDGEDHDWNEVRSCGLFDAEMNSTPVALAERPPGQGGPVARVLLDETNQDALEKLRAVLPPTEFTPDLLASIGRAYRVGNGMAEAFAEWLESVLGRLGLIVFDASDPVAKPLAAPVFARELAHPGATAQLAAEAGLALEALGCHAQVTQAAGTVALFSLGATRDPIRFEAGRFTIGDSAESPESAESLAERAMRAPESFSPNVLLRPIVQDSLFPTACYISGPSELAYLGQLAGVYRAFGVPMPLIQPRASATILDANAMRFLGSRDVSFASLRARDDAALNELLQAQLPPGLERSMEDAVTAVKSRMAQLAADVRQLDPTLEAATASAQGRMQDDLKKLHGKIIQAAKRKNETLRRQFTHAQAQAFPNGHPQEREIGFVSFLNRYGPPLVDRLVEELPLDPGAHWVLSP